MNELTLLKKHRQNLGISQQEMADRLNMSYRAYQNLETGKTELKVEIMKKMAMVLNIDPREILQMDNKGTVSAATPTSQPAIQSFRFICN